MKTLLFWSNKTSAPIQGVAVRTEPHTPPIPEGPPAPGQGPEAPCLKSVRETVDRQVPSPSVIAKSSKERVWRRPSPGAAARAVCFGGPWCFVSCFGLVFTAVRCALIRSLEYTDGDKPQRRLGAFQFPHLQKVEGGGGRADDTYIIIIKINYNKIIMIKSLQSTLRNWQRSKVNNVLGEF